MHGNLYGSKLISLLAESTGLPKEYAEKKLITLIEQSGVLRNGSSQNDEPQLTLEDLTIEHLRSVLSDFMQDTLIHAKQEHSKLAPVA